MKRYALFTIVASLAFVGCSPTTPTAAGTTGSTPKTETAPNPNLTTVSAKDGSFTISIPKDWVIASSSEPKFVAALKKVGREDAIKQIEGLSAQPYFKLMVMDLKGIEAKKEFVDNLNVVVLAASGAPPSDMKAAADEASKQVFGTEPHTTTVVDTPNGKVGKYSGSTSIGSDKKHDLIGGVLLHNGEAVTVSLSTSAGDGQKFDAVFDEIVSSIKFK